MSKTIEDRLNQEYTVPELKTLLRKYNLSPTGNKTALVKRVSSNLDIKFEEDTTEPEGQKEIVLVRAMLEFDAESDNPTYKLVDLPKYAKKLAESNDDFKDIIRKMKKIFKDPRYKNNKIIRTKVNKIIRTMPYQDLIAFLERIYKLAESNKYVSNDELLYVFSDPRFLRNQQIKYDVVKWLLTRDKRRYVIMKMFDSFLFGNYIRHNISLLNLGGEYIAWNDWELVNLAFDREEDEWLTFIVVSNLDLLKEKDLPFLNRIAKHLHDVFKHDKYIINEIISKSQIGTFDIRSEYRRIEEKIAKEMNRDWVYLFIKYREFSYKLKTLSESDLKWFENIKALMIKYEKEFKYDLKKGDLGEFLKSNYHNYPYLKTYHHIEYKDNGSIAYFISDGITMYFPSSKDRQTLLTQIRDYSIEIFEMDDRDVLEMMIEDLEKVRDEKISKELSEINRKLGLISSGSHYYDRDLGGVKYEEIAVTRMLQVTQKCDKDLEEDIKWLKEVLDLIPGGKEYGKVVERQKKIKENPSETMKLYRQSLRK